MDENTYLTLANQEISSIFNYLEENDSENFLELELQNDVLYIDLPDGNQYVVNKHRPTKQIWLSSPKSGAWHFNFESSQKAWISTKNSLNLQNLLFTEIVDYIDANE